MDQRGWTQNAAWLPLAITLWAALHPSTSPRNWRVQAVCARTQLLQFQMPKLIFVQMSDPGWVWKQAMGWITELCGPVSPAASRLRLSRYNNTTSTQLLWEKQEWSWLKGKTGANSTHRLKICVWGTQLNQFGKQTKWPDLQRLQRGTPRCISHKTDEKEVPNFCPGPTLDLPMRNPACLNRSLIYYPVLKLCIFFISEPYIQYMWSTVLLAQQESLSCSSSVQMIISAPLPRTVVHQESEVTSSLNQQV